MKCFTNLIKKGCPREEENVTRGIKKYYEWRDELNVFTRQRGI